MSRNLKYLVGYAGWREWRWHAHQKQLRNQGQPTPHYSNSAFIITGIFMLLLSIPYFALVIGTPILGWAIFFNMIWNLVAVIYIVAGVRGE